MGEYADIEIERQIRETGRNMMREAAQQAARERKAAGLQQCARDLAVHDAREAAIAAALTVAETQAEAMAARSITIARSGNLLEAKHGRSVLGHWRPDKLTGVVRSTRVVTRRDWSYRANYIDARGAEVCMGMVTA
jgi:hypothetical protein